jgi:hypothetical protein
MNEKQFYDLLQSYSACETAIEWAKGKDLKPAPVVIGFCGYSKKQTPAISFC